MGILKNLLPVVLLAGLAIWLGLIALALANAEALECEQWRKDAELYPLYEYTNWQVEQCQDRGQTR